MTSAECLMTFSIHFFKNKQVQDKIVYQKCCCPPHNLPAWPPHQRLVPDDLSLENVLVYDWLVQRQLGSKHA